jgi:hypothetical protein
MGPVPHVCISLQLFAVLKSFQALSHASQHTGQVGSGWVMSGLQQQQQKALMNLSVSTNGNHAQKEVVGRKKGRK